MGIIKFLSSALIGLTMISTAYSTFENIDICSCETSIQNNCSNSNSNSPSINCQTFPLGYCITQVNPCSGDVISQHSIITTSGDKIIINNYNDIECNTKIPTLTVTCGECNEYFNYGFQGLCNDNDNTNNDNDNNSFSTLEISLTVVGAFVLVICSCVFFIIIVMFLYYLFRKYKDSKYSELLH